VFSSQIQFNKLVLGKAKFEILLEWIVGQDSQVLIANLFVQSIEYENIPFFQNEPQSIFSYRSIEKKN
jgi:hypothetical protein